MSTYPTEDDDIVNAFKRIHTSRRSMHLTRQKSVTVNYSSSRNVFNNLDSSENRKRRGRPPKRSNKGKQRMR